MPLALLALSSCSAGDPLTPGELQRLDALEQARQAAVLTVESPGEKALLETPSRPVDPAAPGIGRLVKHLEKTARQQGGAGIAAVQVGIPVRLVLLRRRDGGGERFQPFFNPAIVRRSARRIASWENCLSVPWGYRFTLRPARIAVRYQTPAGQTLEETLEGEEAVVFQQEADHLDGLLLSGRHAREWFIPAAEMAAFAGEIWRQCQSLARRQCDGLMASRWQARAKSMGKPLP